MDLEIRKAGLESVELLADLRMEFVRDVHPEYDDDLVRNMRCATLHYLRDLLAAKSYIGFIGKASEVIACSASLLIYSLPPLKSASTRKIGHVLNFFTRLDFRRRGCGLALMEFIKASAREEGIERLVLNATESGYPLYRKAGFTEPRDKSMFLDL